jgi:hypothetical protein
LENGSAKDLGVILGDETETSDFVLPEEHPWMKYRKVDFANIGIPIYMRKANHVPSNYNSTWYLKVRFFLYNSDDSVIELDNLEIYDFTRSKHKLVQMWHKEIDNKVYTFRIYHVSDYNYVLNTILVEGDNVTQLRNDIFSPIRKFVLTENIKYHYM